MTIVATENGFHGDIEHDINALERLVADLRRIRNGEAPTEKDLADAPIISDYALTARPAACLIGAVTGHPKLVGRCSVTSELWAVAPKLGWARTLSRFYLLGRPLEHRGASDA
ncbi:DUF6634 family protein [Inquilinus sp. CAU 1745]|uniref:DUF6634 family protein n=1 Tax=Inquilinus sp. CAU 1745 TaxID=3140369 RepID=UPI00325A55E0